MGRYTLRLCIYLRASNSYRVKGVLEQEGSLGGIMDVASLIMKVLSTQPVMFPDLTVASLVLKVLQYR